jgi:nucleotide-binding universal stress UspA family protein
MDTKPPYPDPAMHILIATTGVLPPVPVAELCEQLLREEGQVTVMTVIQVPRDFLASMEDEERRSFLDDTSWQSSTAEMKALTYLEERGRRAVEPVMAAFRARGREPEVRFVEGSDPVEAIVGTATGVGADIIVMGATRRLFTEQAWTSVSARVMERSQCPLLLVPGQRSEETTEPARLEL